MKNRRDFLKTGAILCSGLPILSAPALASQKDTDRAKEWFDPGLKLPRDGIKFAKKNKKNNIPPVLRDEILENPRAVFIIKTKVVSNRDEDGLFPAEREQFEREGYKTAQKLFRKGTGKGGTTYIKPNFVGGFSADDRSVNNGSSAHPSFVAGFIDALKEMGNTNIIVGANGAASHKNFVESGICEMMHNRGVCFYEGGRTIFKFKDYKKSEIMWMDNPEGVVMRKIPFFRPTQEKDTTLINIAKDRPHPTAFTTLTIKNHQGIMPVGYMHICCPWRFDGRGDGTTWSIMYASSLQPSKKVFNPDYQREIERLYIKHARMGYKYWDEGGYVRDYYKAGGWEAYRKGSFKPDHRVFHHEMWAQRMLDVVSTSNPYVNIVDGIVSHKDEGNPGLQLNNFITISRSMVECDSVTNWLMGHDPREIPYMRIANERGMGENDIEKITIYEITDHGIERVKDYRELKRARIGVRIESDRRLPLRYF